MKNFRSHLYRTYWITVISTLYTVEYWHQSTFRHRSHLYFIDCIIFFAAKPNKLIIIINIVIIMCCAPTSCSRPRSPLTQRFVWACCVQMLLSTLLKTFTIMIAYSVVYHIFHWIIQKYLSLYALNVYVSSLVLHIVYIIVSFKFILTSYGT